MISVERGASFSSKGIKSGRNREHNRNGTLRRQRRRRRMLKQILVCILGIFLVAVIGICFVINWFTKITPAIGKTEIAEIEEMVSGHSVIKAFNAEDKTITMFDKDNKKLSGRIVGNVRTE
jgi:ABC-type multidrug transport system fused ATPase/permease subunit